MEGKCLTQDMTEARLNKHIWLKGKAAPLPRHVDTLWSRGLRKRSAEHVHTPTRARTPAP